MFSVGELLSKRNQRDALTHFEQKKDSCGADGVHLSELQEYWQLNSDSIIADIKTMSYYPGVIKIYEIINGKGKRREISNLNTIDKFISRMLAQKLKRYIEPEFLENSFAYQDGKGVLDAVQKAKIYIEQGKNVVVEIDLKNYFDSINIETLLTLLKKRISDMAVLCLIERLMYCDISVDNEIKQKRRGIIQGNPMSPVLSNLYLHEFDLYLQEKGYCWIRFADDINIYTDSLATANKIYDDVCQFLQKEPWSLEVSTKKSGIYKNAKNRRLLGYEFYEKKHGIEIRKCQYSQPSVYREWHPCVVQKINQEYHMIQDGILNKKDFALLFENESQKHHIPVETTQQLNIYGEITLTSSVLSTISRKNIRIAFMDKYGNLMGHFVPDEYTYSATISELQFAMYSDEEKRLELAKKFEIAAIHNMRANLRYYNKKMRGTFDKAILELSNYIQKTVDEEEISNLMLIEARAKQQYYLCFNKIISNQDFNFVKRTRRPPEDELNAMISFGNTLLYNLFLQIIWRMSLDPRVGVVHATNRRSHSLNLDFADIFKPVIIDRIIFSLINCHQIKTGHFEKRDEGVFLTKEGKKIFIAEFEAKLQQKFVRKENKACTYRQLLEDEVRQYQRYISGDGKYKPFKYY